MAVALWANAILLGAILVALITRANSPSLLPMAFAADEAGKLRPHDATLRTLPP